MKIVLYCVKDGQHVFTPKKAMVEIRTEISIQHSVEMLNLFWITFCLWWAMIAKVAYTLRHFDITSVVITSLNFSTFWGQCAIVCAWMKIDTKTSHRKIIFAGGGFAFFHDAIKSQARVINNSIFTSLALMVPFFKGKPSSSILCKKNLCRCSVA